MSGECKRPISPSPGAAGLAAVPEKNPLDRQVSWRPLDNFQGRAGGCLRCLRMQNLLSPAR